MRSRRFLGLLVSLLASRAAATEPGQGRLPQVWPGWTIELALEAPRILYPTAIATAPDGTVFLGQDPMDMPGPPDDPADSVAAIRDGKITVFADKLWSVMGLEWVDGTLYVVHAALPVGLPRHRRRWPCRRAGRPDHGPRSGRPRCGRHQ